MEKPTRQGPSQEEVKQEHDIPQTLPGLLRVLSQNGRLAEFFETGNKEMARIEAIQDPTTRTEEWAKLVGRFTKE